jgi:CRP/FNR family transcriptional regulator
MDIESLFKDNKLIEELKKFSTQKLFTRDSTIFESGEEIRAVPIVLTGVLRIVRQDDEGNEVFLYHLYPGETCAMALNCCQAGNQSKVKAIAEDQTELLLIPVRQISDWFRFEEWKIYVNQTYGKRFNELLEVIDLIAFSNMDKQLLHYLQERCKANNTTALFITHQQIADEMHTQREAISRLLRTMEQKNLVKLGRNTIELR